MAPVQFKGEIMDFDLGMEIDHRKRYVCPVRAQPGGRAGALIPAPRVPPPAARCPLLDAALTLVLSLS